MAEVSAAPPLSMDRCVCDVHHGWKQNIDAMPFSSTARQNALASETTDITPSCRTRLGEFLEGTKYYHLLFLPFHRKL